MKRANLSRRDFLKLATLGADALAFRPFAKLDLSEFPKADKWGRITVGKVDVCARLRKCQPGKREMELPLEPASSPD